MTYERPEWHYEGACSLTSSADMSKNFFDSNGNSDLAKRLCADCRVQTTCLDYAIRTNQGHGIWGGLDTGQRAKAKRKKPALREKYIESIIKPYRRH